MRRRSGLPAGGSREPIAGAAWRAIRVSDPHGGASSDPEARKARTQGEDWMGIGIVSPEYSQCGRS